MKLGDFVAIALVLKSCSFSSCVFLGGSGGSVAGSYTGARIREPSIDGALDIVVRFVPFVPMDRPETEDNTDETDSCESRRFN